MRYLKEFTNLLEVLFTQQCPFWISMNDAIDTLLDYTAEEQASLQRSSCNAILWITMRQARSFSAGCMSEPGDVTPEYTEMMIALKIHRQIEFGGLPASMQKRKAEPDDDRNDKRQHTSNNGNSHGNNGNSNGNNNRNNNNNNNNRNPPPVFTCKNCQHPKLKAAFNTIKHLNGVPPQVYKLCEYCDTKWYLLLPNKRDFCTK